MTTYKLDELAREADVSPRTIRYYVQRGLLPAPDFHGSQTTYGRAHLVRLKAIKRLQEEHLPLEEISARLGGRSVEELERVVSTPIKTPKVSSSAGGSPYRVAPPIPAMPVDGNGWLAAAQPQTWERVELLPGVELHVRSDVSPLARRIAREIQSNYGTIAPLSAEKKKE